MIQLFGASLRNRQKPASKTYFRSSPFVLKLIKNFFSPTVFFIQFYAFFNHWRFWWSLKCSVSRSSLGLKSIIKDAGTRTRNLSTKLGKRVSLPSALHPHLPECTRTLYRGPDIAGVPCLHYNSGIGRLCFSANRAWGLSFQKKIFSPDFLKSSCLENSSYFP